MKLIQSSHPLLNLYEKKLLITNRISPNELTSFETGHK